jgi:iron only hydrogenase large subunit-like protein
LPQASRMWDVVITTEELARMIKQAGIDFLNLPDEEPDYLLGAYSGAGTIFGATGGVMEAALRSAYHFITDKHLKNVEFSDLRGIEGVKTAEIPIEGKTIRVAVAHGLSNVFPAYWMKYGQLRRKGKRHHFISLK